MQGLSSTEGQYEWTKPPMSPGAYSYCPIRQFQVAALQCESKQILQVVLGVSVLPVPLDHSVLHFQSKTL